MKRQDTLHHSMVNPRIVCQRSDVYITAGTRTHREAMERKQRVATLYVIMQGAWDPGSGSPGLH
jgi:hypothetical protein